VKVGGNGGTKWYSGTDKPVSGRCEFNDWFLLIVENKAFLIVADTQCECQQ